MKYIIPVCIVGMLGIQIYDYFANGEFNIMFVAIACFLTPAGIKGFNPEYAESKQFKTLSTILLVIGLIFFSISLYITM